MHDKLRISAQSHSGLAAVRHWCPCGWNHPVTRMPVPTPHPSLVTALCTHRPPPPPTLHSANTTQVPQHLQRPFWRERSFTTTPSAGVLHAPSTARTIRMHAFNRCAVMRSTPSRSGNPHNTRAQSKPRTTQSADNRNSVHAPSRFTDRRPGRPTQTPATAAGHDFGAGRDAMQAGVRRRTPRQTGQQTGEHRDRQVASQ